MTAYLFANHLANFLAPSVFLALGLVLVSRFLPFARRAAAPSWQRQFMRLLAVNVLVSTAALLGWGQDGKLMTYAAMAAASASMQWWLLRGGKA